MLSLTCACRPHPHQRTGFGPSPAVANACRWLSTDPSLNPYGYPQPARRSSPAPSSSPGKGRRTLWAERRVAAGGSTKPSAMRRDSPRASRSRRPPRALRRAVAAGRAVTRAWFTQRAHPETVDSTRGSARVVHRKTCRAGPAACPPAAFHAWWSSTFPRADRDDPVPRN